MNVHNRMRLRAWFNEGRRQGSSYMLVVLNSLEGQEHPVFVNPNEDVMLYLQKYRLAPIERVMEVYDLSKNRDDQIMTPRTWTVPKPANDSSK